MADIDLVRLPNITLGPSLESDEEKILKWKVGEILRCRVWKPRNINFHRKFFALLQVVFHNQDRYDNLEDLRVEIELKCGNYFEHVTTKGRIIYYPKSIAFHNMDEIEFSKLYENAIDVCRKYFCVGSTREEIDRKVNEVMNFWW